MTSSIRKIVICKRNTDKVEPFVTTKLYLLYDPLIFLALKDLNWNERKELCGFHS